MSWCRNQDQEKTLLFDNQGNTCHGQCCRLCRPDPFVEQNPKSLSRLLNAGEDYGFYDAVAGWVSPATTSGSVGGRIPLPTVRSEGACSPAFRKIGRSALFGRLVRFDGWCTSTSSVTSLITVISLITVTGRTTDPVKKFVHWGTLLPVLASQRLSQGATSISCHKFFVNFVKLSKR